MKNRTTVVIAHRLSTIRQADQILVLEHGRIIESGTHDFLCQLGRRYWKMYSRQRGLRENLITVHGEERWDREGAGA
jgi:ABC-type multidrug transport system fused ATPase/permease subunit